MLLEIYVEISTSLTMCYSKAVACKSGVVVAMCELLSSATLDSRAAAHMVLIIESLASYSISANELKHLFLLLRTDQDQKVCLQSYYKLTNFINLFLLVCINFINYTFSSVNTRPCRQTMQNGTISWPNLCH